MKCAKKNEIQQHTGHEMVCSHGEGNQHPNHERQWPMLLRENLWLRVSARLHDRTYILDIIRGY